MIPNQSEDQILTRYFKYFDLENKLIADEYYQSENEKNYKYEVDLKGCQDLDQINDFFFMTYSGNKTMKDKELEKIRRVLLSWRDFMIENMDKNNYLSKKITDTLVNTKKLMDIKVSN